MCPLSAKNKIVACVISEVYWDVLNQQTICTHIYNIYSLRSLAQLFTIITLNFIKQIITDNIIITTTRTAQGVFNYLYLLLIIF